MPKANKKEATIATQRREHLQFTSFHKPSSPFVAIITSKPQQQRNSIHSNPTNHRHSFIILDDDLTLPLHTVIWAKQHGKIFKHHCRPGISAIQARLFILSFTQGRTPSWFTGSFGVKPAVKADTTEKQNYHQKHKGYIISLIRIRFFLLLSS